MIVDTFYFLIKLYKKVCVSRLRKKRGSKSRKIEMKKNIKIRSTLTFKLGPNVKSILS